MVIKSNWMDGYLKSNLEIFKEKIKHDFDFIYLVDGREGSGKSVLAMQIAKYMDDTFDLSRVCFTPDDFKEVVLNAQPNQAVIFDEAITGLGSRWYFSFINKTIVDMLAQIRQKNLTIGIVLPSFFDLDRNIGLWRSTVLFHVYLKKDAPVVKQRGWFTYFDYERKKTLYLMGKKLYSYHKPPANFHGRFLNKYTVDEQGYRKKKADALADYKDKKQGEKVYRKSAFENRSKWLMGAFIMLNKDFKLSQDEIAKTITEYGGKSITRHTVGDFILGKIDLERGKG